MTKFIWFLVVTSIFSPLAKCLAPPFVKNVATIEMKIGDRIWCHSNPLNPVYHSLLASSNDTFIHVVGSQSTHRAIIKEQTRKQWMETGYAEEYCINEGPGPLGVASINLAYYFIGKRTYYDLLTCNCQHYLNYWTSGSSGISFNSRLRTSKRCFI